jgi:hypothetical protein
MTRHILLRIIAGLVLLAAIAGIAFFAYHVGATHATGISPSMPAAANGMPYYPFFWHPLFGAGIFIVLFGLFLLMIAFSAMRMLVFGPRWGWRHMHHGEMGHHPMGHGPWSEGVPPMFAEWHRRAHANPEEPGEKKTGE